MDRKVDMGNLAWRLGFIGAASVFISIVTSVLGYPLPLYETGMALLIIAISICFELRENDG